MDPKEALMDIRKYLHDLNQPLTTAFGLIFLISQELTNDSKIDKELITLNDQLEQIKKIAENIHNIARAATRQ